MVICLVRGADLHTALLMPLPLTVSCFSKIQIGFTFLVLADPGSPGQRAVKRMWVCVYVTWLGVFVKQQSYTDTAVCMYRIQPICRESCRSMRILQLSYLPTWLALRLSLRLAKT